MRFTLVPERKIPARKKGILEDQYEDRLTNIDINEDGRGKWAQV
jgi:hypothetical protein